MVEFLTSQLGISVLVILVSLGVILGIVAYSMFYERKVAGWMQDRYGPNRVGPKGLLQPIADGVKALLKEDIIPAMVDAPLFVLAPALSLVVALIGFAVIPWGGVLTFADGHTVMIQAAGVDVGLLYILAVGSVSVYGIVLGGWASNNKYSFYGGLRAAAQNLSYEVPMGLAILVVVLTSGHLRLENIVAAQAETCWYILVHPLAFIILMITFFAETNRTPFDLVECEQELVGGFHTEYSSMKFAMFFLAEYSHMVVGSAFVVSLFLGGYHLPGIPWLQPDSTGLFSVLAKSAVYGMKIAAFIFLFMWVRWTIPRFRFDQLMRLAWKGLVPFSLGLVGLTCALVYIDRPVSAWATIGDVVLLVVVWIALDLSKTPLTGRQSNLPPIRGAEQPAGTRV